MSVEGLRSLLWSESPSMKAWMDKAEPWLVHLLNEASKWRIKVWSTDSDDGPEEIAEGEGRTSVHMLAGAECVGSRNADGMHRIMLDLDIQAALVKSSTRGDHHHLYLGTREIEWGQYQELLKILMECGVIEQGYYHASVKRGETFLRLPWVRKGHEREDGIAAMTEWLDEPEEVPVPPL